MRSLSVLSEFGGPEKLQVRTIPDLPEPTEGQVRVKVLTAGTGFTDTIVRQGQYVGVKEKPPFVPGYDWFGVVDKVGPGVTALKPGDPVADMPVIFMVLMAHQATPVRLVPVISAATRSIFAYRRIGWSRRRRVLTRRPRWR